MEGASAVLEHGDYTPPARERWADIELDVGLHGMLWATVSASHWARHELDTYGVPAAANRRYKFVIGELQKELTDTLARAGITATRVGWFGAMQEFESKMHAGPVSSIRLVYQT